MSNVNSLGQWKRPTKQVYICQCGSGVYEVELLKKDNEDDVLVLRCWGCGEVHWNMQVKEEEFDDEE